MDNKRIRRDLYRALRKTGIQKHDIQPEALYKEDLNFDNVDWKIFTFYLEGLFDISIKDEDLNRLISVKSTIQFLGNFGIN